MKKPYAWQINAVEQCAKKVFFCINAHCGVGKTLAGILIALKKEMPTIIIAPTHSVCDQWEEAIKEVAGEDADVWTYARLEESKNEEEYRERFTEWLTS